jgi:heme ABC exporter ATP-binding subunit CcmA
MPPSRDGAPLLAARDLQRSFGRARVLRGVDLSLRPGEALAVIGPNGAGKTTLLRLLAGLMRPSAGTIELLGQPFRRGSDPARSVIGLLSHQSLLYDDLTVRENLVFAARLHVLDQPRGRADAALDAAGLSPYADTLPRRLSRGLLQRAAIARALLHSPRILLLDEPFTALDAAAAERLRADLSGRIAQGAALAMVTHQLADIWDLSSRVGVLVEGRWALQEPRAGSLDAFNARYGVLAGA